jgi:hypothetical protein
MGKRVGDKHPGSGRLTWRGIVEYAKMHDIPVGTLGGRKAVRVLLVPVEDVQEQARIKRAAKGYTNKKEMKALKRARVREMKARSVHE